jgi:aryl-alcohol dehydrogenase-like predicted oxidoreductase
MKQRRVGNTGLTVSRLGLGTMTRGRDTDEHEARDPLVAFCDAGGTLLDTAHSYADGASEELVGQLLGSVVSRDEVVLASKAGVGVRRKERVFDASRGYLLQCLDTSLRRLGVDHLDLWQVHVWSDATPVEETLSALDVAVSSGRASYVGVSNWSGWQTALGATWQRAVPGRALLATNQVEYSLLNRSPEAEVVPAAAACGMGILPWSPLGRGILTGKYRSGTPADSRGASPHLSGFIDPLLTERNRSIVESVSRAADGLGWTPLEVALAWVRDRPGVTAPIVGARTAAHLKGSLSVEECELPTEITEALDDVSGDAAGEVP